MKRTILILAIIVIAAPVWAAVTITATHEGCGVVRIDYSVSSEPNKVRAFGLDIVVSDGNIMDVTNFFEASVMLSPKAMVSSRVRLMSMMTVMSMIGVFPLEIRISMRPPVV